MRGEDARGAGMTGARGDVQGQGARGVGDVQGEGARGAGGGVQW